MGQHAEQMIALGMAGIDGENLPVDRLRLLRPSGPVVFHALAEQQR